MSASVLIMAGGTGGHVFPALAVARVLRERGFTPVWLGTERGMENKLVPQHHIDMELIAVSGLRGKGAGTLVLAPFRLLRAVSQAVSIMRKRKPAVVFGAGGFASGPGGIAAWLLRKPLVIHEQNAIAGMTNRWLSRLATQVFEAFPNSFPRAVCVGNPVRREIAALPAPEKRFAGRTGAIRLLVVGGSLGAARLNSAVPGALKLLAEELLIDVWHQTGERGHEQTVKAYADALPPSALQGKAGGTTARIVPFIDDMADAYAWADLLVCRAGALTISELAAAGIGAILVPFPAAVDDHQTHNARYLTEAGAAVLIADRDLTPERLAAELRELCASNARGGNRTKLLHMANCAREQAIVDADAHIADVCIALAGGAA